MPEYAYLKQVIEKARAEATELLRGRFPTPRYVDTEHESSQARFLVSKVNPSQTHNSMFAYGQVRFLFLKNKKKYNVLGWSGGLKVTGKDSTFLYRFCV